jgi:DNA-binding transcriptional LysR family regulator
LTGTGDNFFKDVLTMHFDIADMQLFLKVASAGSLTQGAREGARSTSAASTRLKSLENQLGTRLFYREPNGLTLTSAGIEFLAHAKRIIAEYELAKNAFQKKNFSSPEHLRVIANSASTSEIIPEVILTLLHQNPEITIDVQQKSIPQAIRSILDNEADIAVVAGMDDLKGLNSILFAIDYLVIIAPKNHPILGSPVKNIQEVSRHPMLTISGSTLFHFLNEKLKDVGCRGTYRILLDGFEPIVRLVEAGAGIAIIPESVATRFKKKFDFEIAELQEDWAFRERRIIFNEVRFLSPSTVNFIKVVVEKYLRTDFDKQSIESFLEIGPRPPAAKPDNARPLLVMDRE